jgi:hypothetical protein
MASAFSAPANHQVYYDTLTELDTDAVPKVYYDNLTELDAAAKELRRILDTYVQNPENPLPEVNDNLLVKIFSNNQPIKNLKPVPKQDGHPIIIITAGSPGVGKSTITGKEFRQYGINPNKKVFTVSMDTLLERSHLFREKTLELYHSVRSIKKMQNSEELTNQNYATLSGVSATAYSSREYNFDLIRKAEAIKGKYLGTNTSKASTRKKPQQRSQRSRSRSRSPKRSPTRKRSRSPPRQIMYNLEEIREIGFEFGVANGLNILFDCTLSHTGKRMNSIMTILQKYAELGQKYANLGGPQYKKYQIKVLLIKARNDIKNAKEREKDDDLAAAIIIRDRIIGRHVKMVRNGYLRSLTTSINAIKGMIKQNRAGYHTAKETYFYKNGDRNQPQVVNPPYRSEDFDFEEIVNEEIVNEANKALLAATP